MREPYYMTPEAVDSKNPIALAMESVKKKVSN